MIIEAFIVAGAILIASAALIYFLRTDDIRVTARTLVRATEKRGEWDVTINSEHIKRARVMLVLQDKYPKLGNDWLSIIIEEAVFDMEADRGTSRKGTRYTITGSDTGQYDRLAELEDGTVGIDDDRDSRDPGDRRANSSWDTTGGVEFEAEPEDLEIPSSE